MKTRLWSLVTGITLLLLVLVPNLSAHADGEDDAKTTWAVAPADADGPDGRRVMEFEADPGESIEDHFAVTNLSTHEVTFSLRAADGYFNENGRFNTIPSDRESVESGTWFSVPEQVTIPAKETAVVPMSITVPEDAEPGDHAAGVSASIMKVTTDQGGSTVGVESRVGFRVTVTVTGEVRAVATVEDVTTSYDTNWSPVQPGSASVQFTVNNDGNVRFLGQGVLRIGGQEIAFPAGDDSRQELLPGDSRSFTVEVDGLWPTFIVGGTIDLQPQGVGERAEQVEFPTVSAKADLIAIPWPQLAVLLGVVLLIVAALWNRGRNKAKVADLVAKAHEEGRRSAQEEGS